MIVLQELVNYSLAQIGHLLIPIDVFGLTSPVLERLMLSSLNKYQKYRPVTKKAVVNIGLNPLLIPDAQKVVSVKPFVSNAPEYPSSINYKDWSFNTLTKELTSTYESEMIIEYLANYIVENNTLISYSTNELFSDETNISIPLLEYFKKGTLNITLDDGIVIPSENFTVDVDNDTFIISNTSLLYSKLTHGSIVKLSTDNILPNPLNSTQNYYVIQKKDTNDFQLSLNYDNFSIEDRPFTTNYLTNPTYLVLTNHGLSNNQSVQLYSDTLLPTPLSSNFTYYVNVIDSNTIELKTSPIMLPINLINNGVGIQYLHTGFININDIGTGIHSMSKMPFQMKEVLSSYSAFSPESINLTGTLGDAVLGLIATDVILPNNIVYDISKLELLIHNIKAKFVDSAVVTISFVSQYKTIKEMSLEDEMFTDLFTGELMKSLGSSKSITKLDGLPFDVSVDDLYSKGDDLVNKTLEDLRNSRSKWYIWR